MPLGLFSLVAVGVHAGALVVGDGLLTFFDALDGAFDRSSTAALLDLGRWLHLSAQTVDRWTFGVVSLVDLRERELAARWIAVGIELWADAVLALPALGYHELGALEHAALGKREPPHQGTAGGAAFGRPIRLESPHQGTAGGAAFGRSIRLERRHLFKQPPSGPLALARAIAVRPSLARLLLPVCTAAVALAGACRVATEMQASAFAALVRALPPAPAGMVGRSLAIALLIGLLACLGGRAVVQSARVVYRRSERDATGPARFWLRGWPALAVAVPLGALALAHGAPLLSFFR